MSNVINLEQEKIKRLFAEKVRSGELIPVIIDINQGIDTKLESEQKATEIANFILSLEKLGKGD